MSGSLSESTNTEYQGVKELADAAERFLRSAGPSQEKGTVTEYPNERTVRFYLSEGLLPPATEKRGATSIFCYQHLLSLLVVKKLQADGLPIAIIRQLITGKSESELEALLGEQASVKIDEDPDGVFPLYSVSQTALPDGYGGPLISANAMAISEDRMPPEKNSAKEYLESLLFARSTPDESEGLFSVAPSASPAPDPRLLKSTIPPARAASWRREELAPGLEIHVREDFEPPSGYRQMSKLLAKIKEVLRR
ncbi:MAG: MerR family transcriptional regulator [Acidobacteriota bacterium]